MQPDEGMVSFAPLLSHQPFPEGFDNCLRLRVNMNFFINVVNVEPDCTNGNTTFVGDHFIAVALYKALKNIHFP